MKISPPVGYTHKEVKRSEKRHVRKGIWADNLPAAFLHGTAKEVLFITIKNETAFTKLVVWTTSYKKYCKEIF